MTGSIIGLELEVGMVKMKRFIISLILLTALSGLFVGCGGGWGGGGGGGGGVVYQPVLHSSNLVNGIITVDPGGYYRVRFSVTSTMTDAAVVGSFTASGGSGNDIETYILDDMAFTNWINGHTVNTLYNSGRITVAEINTPITTPGTYYLVFNNEFSTFASKEVTTTVNLQWYE